jgi:aminoglycoside phosphotransferase (APT) family kinase protein
MDALDQLAAREGLEWGRADAESVWSTAAALPWAATHWVHADLHVKNIVTRRGRLASILDWGEAGAGDPAQDLGQVWPMCEPREARAALAAYGTVDDDTLARARGEALAAAVRHLSTGDAGFLAGAWRALVSLGVASGPAPRASSPREAG